MLVGWTKFGGWSCSSTSFVGLDFLPSFCKCSAPLNMLTMICCDEFCCLRCNFSGQRWAVTIPIRDKDLPRFDCCQFPNAVIAATVSHPLREWIAGRSLAMYSILAGVSAKPVLVFLSIWWNHVHRGSLFRRKKTSTSSDFIVTCGHDWLLCYHNDWLFVTWSQVKLRINVSFRNGCWVGSCTVSINRWCCVAWAKYDRSSKMSSKISLFSCILILVTDKTISRGGSLKSLFSWCTLEQVRLSFRATDLVL